MATTFSKLLAAGALVAQGALAAPTVSKLVLIDADRDVALVTLVSNAAINLAELPTRRLNIQAFLSDATKAEFTYDGKVVATESTAPFAAFGDSGGDFKPWTPAVGTHALKVRPYRNTVAGTSVTLNFVVTDTATSPPNPAPSPPPVPTPPTTEGGWTEFKPSSDSRIIYVSSSSGSDSNPGTQSAPVKTAAKAASLTRDGFPDWILFKRGDSFSGKVSLKNGRSATERALAGAYGEGARPYFAIEPSSTPMDACGSNKVFTSLHFKSYKRDPTRAGFDRAAVATTGVGVRCVWGTLANIHHEDVMMEYFVLPFYYDGGQGSHSNVTIRRCVIKNSWASNGTITSRKSQGMYMNVVKGLRIEENLFYMNGWNPTIADADRSFLNHSVYVNDITDLVIKGNISALSSSLGLKINSSARGSRNVTIDDNLIVGSANGLTVLSNDDVDNSITNVKIRNNVHTHVGAKAETHGGVSEQNLGMRVRDIAGLEVTGNLFIDKNYWDMSQRAIEWTQVSGTQLSKNNVSYRYVNTGKPVFGGPSDSSNWGEGGAGELVDASRDIDSYFGVADGAAQLYREMVKQRKGAWNPAITASAISAWLRAGLRKR